MTAAVAATRTRMNEGSDDTKKRSENGSPREGLTVIPLILTSLETKGDIRRRRNASGAKVVLPSLKMPVKRETPRDQAKLETIKPSLT
jgi:hypothetical protein